MHPDPRPRRRRFEVTGIVQGVGFRPAIHRLASDLGLTGFVGNDAHGVFIEVEGPAEIVAGFADELVANAPPLAVIHSVSGANVEPTGSHRFTIVESVGGAPTSTSALVSPDVGPCDECLAEMADPSDRRYRYPFINCTNCGPRYSIVTGVPYDRPMTTMAGFEMCPPCAAEYSDPDDRRYHAQPTCCPDCGPHLRLRDEAFEPVDGLDDAEVVSALVAWLGAGRIVAVKGLGGYHLAVDATNHEAVARLRSRKHRYEKPFALLVANASAAAEIAVLASPEADLLESAERPILLLRRRAGSGPELASSIAPGNRSLGLMLPPTPLHVMLAEQFDGPLVLTSGNRSDEPIVFADEDVHDRLSGIADGYCTHDRPIHTRVDDSVARVVSDRQIVIRRARGHVPRPMKLPLSAPVHILACGAQLKSTVCVARDDQAVVSQHLGDLENLETYESFGRTVEHLCGLFEVHPGVVAHDLHPGMLSTAFATAYAEERNIERVSVQHHHAHVAACLVDNDLSGEVIGVAFDGLGFGTDGSMWGGEFLIADLVEFDRVGHLVTVPMPGGDRATRQPWRMAAVHLARVLGVNEIETLGVFERNHERWNAVLSVAASGINAPATSSAGRLFDAVAAIIGVRDEVSYEGQAAVELEQLASEADVGAYRVELIDGDPFVIDPSPIVAAVADDISRGVEPAVMSSRFHHGVVEMIARGCRLIREREGLSTVAISGGVFQNALLVEAVSRLLGGDGFEVLTHRRFPPNDAGISLGQAAIVAARAHLSH